MFACNICKRIYWVAEELPWILDDIDFGQRIRQLQEMAEPGEEKETAREHELPAFRCDLVCGNAEMLVPVIS